MPSDGRGKLTPSAASDSRTWRAAQLPEAGEDESDRLLDPQIGIETQPDLAVPDVADRHADGSSPRRALLRADQGSQFTSPRFTGLLTTAGIRVSMDRRGRWMDNVFIERLWRSLKYECVYLHAVELGSEARAGIGRWIDYYNADRPQQNPGRGSPAHPGRHQTGGMTRT